jgi:hypothetical protein
MLNHLKDYISNKLNGNQDADDEPYTEPIQEEKTKAPKPIDPSSASKFQTNVLDLIRKRDLLKFENYIKRMTSCFIHFYCLLC